MAKHVFPGGGRTVDNRVTSRFMNLVFRHRHDGIDDDGHCDKITKEELADGVIEFIHSVVSDKFIGDIRAYGGKVAPAGYLNCDGGAVPMSAEFTGYHTWAKANRPDLLVYGEQYRTPDLRGRVLIGAGRVDESRSFELGARGGEYEVLLTDTDTPPHRHYGENGKSAGGGGDGTGYFTDRSDVKSDKALGGETLRTWDGVEITDENRTKHENMPPYEVINYVIRVM